MEESTSVTREVLMIKKKFLLNNAIPAVLWGDFNEQLIIAVHGHMSHKEDTAIAMLAEESTAKGYSVLSFDLPEHGERQNSAEICSIENVMHDLTKVWEFAAQRSPKICLFGCSQGAYFSLLTYYDKPIEKALFLSPVVNMERIIQKLMQQANIDEADLQRRGTIPLKFATLYWDYYCYVKNHPITQWPIATAILHGKEDTLCARDTMNGFCANFDAKLTVVESEHYFHTSQQLALYRKWLAANL